MSAGGRTLPIRYAPVVGEALDSWLEFLAARLHCRFSDVLRSLGLPVRDVGLSNPMLPRWAVRSTAAEIASISAASGVAEAVLVSMTLRRFDGYAVVIRPDQRRVERRVLWGRAGSRYCPVCLDESDGRWQLSWRLGWSFACTRHQVLLADRCPACHRIPRVRAHPRRETPRPGRCAGPQLDGPRGARCHHPLSDIPVVALEHDGPVARTQRLIDHLLAEPEQTVHWPLYGAGGASLSVVLRDVRCLGGLILNHAACSDLTEAAEPAVLRQMEVYRSRTAATGARHSRLDAHSYYAPDDAAATAVALATALRVLAAPSVPAAGEAVRWLTERVSSSGRALHPGGMALLSGGSVSPGLQAALRCSREQKVMPVARLRHRTAIASTRAPCNQEVRARVLPTALWPEWTLRLAPWHASGKPVARRTDELLAVACLLVGNTTKIHTAVRLMGTTVSSHNVSSLLAELTRRPDCADVLHALVLLADHLDQHGSPIDYARRRALFTTRSSFIDPEEWRDLQRRLRSNHLPDAAHAQRWIFHTLTGSPPRLAHPAIAPATPSQRGQYLRFRWRILPAEVDLLLHAARAILDEHGIDEPVQWTPRLDAAALSTLRLPGPDPDSISAAELHRAVPGGDFAIARVAHTLNTTTAHAIYLLSQHPVDWSPPRFRHTQYTAARIGQWRTWYQDDHYSLQDIADLEGTTLATVRLALLKYGFPLRTAVPQPGRPSRRIPLARRPATWLPGLDEV
ncbi:TniQ family protein [Streptomyces sp. NPDC048224]|uniref:TniQ family protein n=1 Tax=Streptomyces sp. NPDC048224 TaxID=3154500 RepID=UPI0033EA9A4B